MDPIGLGFAHYDAVGRFRTLENGKPIAVSGQLSQSDSDGTFEGVVQLADRLAQSKQVAACYITQWFRYGYGRGEVADDQATLELLGRQFADSGGDIKELLIAMTQTDEFRFRPTGVTP
jgi:aminoglycoside phosphotransferase (APT) family kinase protein